MVTKSGVQLLLVLEQEAEGAEDVGYLEMAGSPDCLGHFPRPFEQVACPCVLAAAFQVGPGPPEEAGGGGLGHPCLIRVLGGDPGVRKELSAARPLAGVGKSLD